MNQLQAKDEHQYFVSLPDHACFGSAVHLTSEVGEMINTLWMDPAIQSTWAERSKIQVPDASQHYFNGIARISATDYIPTLEDILRARVRTSGVIEERYTIDGTQFLFVDVGGQRNERKKWLHCFDNVNAIIFVTALSEYDQTLFEEETTNRMREALTIFRDICNKYFVDISIILFLNKSDLFAEKVKTKNIGDIPDFSDYSGKPNDYQDGINYFIDRFTEMNQNKKKDIFFHVTCATDTGSIQFVFNSCKEIILQRNLSDHGFVG